MIEKITNKELESYAERVSNDVKFIVAMNPCLIDITNGTNLSRNLGR